MFKQAISVLLFVIFMSTFTSGETLPQQNSYGSLLKEIASAKEKFRADYQAASTDEQRQRIIENAREFIFNSLVNKIFPSWYGTPWDFNGTTQTPNEGYIACGYFVTTTLHHVGFNIPWQRLAQQPAEHIVKNLAQESSIRRFPNNNQNFSKFEEHIRCSGKGLYLVGMDIHVGFVVNFGNELRFVHSSYYNPPLKVVSEPIDSYNPLRHSKYVVVGKLLDDEMVKKWITNERLPIKYDYFQRRR